MPRFLVRSLCFPSTERNIEQLSAYKFYLSLSCTRHYCAGLIPEGKVLGSYRRSNTPVLYMQFLVGIVYLWRIVLFLPNQFERVCLSSNIKLANCSLYICCVWSKKNSAIHGTILVATILCSIAPATNLEACVLIHSNLRTRAVRTAEMTASGQRSVVVMPLRTVAGTR